MIDSLIKNAPSSLDLTNARHLKQITEISETLLNNYKTIPAIDAVEQELFDRAQRVPVFIMLALKLARSRLLVKKLTRPLKVSVVFAVYKEHNRIKRPGEHAHGEDFLRRKVEQLRWLFAGSPHIDWELIIVDDGCPEGSGRIARQIVQEEKLNARVKVLFLQEAIAKGLPVVAGLQSTRDSQKGGAITYGMWYAAENSGTENHVILFTDADLSTHLGQTGLLLAPIRTGGKAVAIGSRREKKSVVIKQGRRNDRGKLFIYLWKRMLPDLNAIIDTQCGFKAFDKAMLQAIIQPLIERKFAIDIELLLKAQLRRPGCIARVPIAWIDSEAASTTTDLQPYLPMLKAIAAMYRNYLPANPQAEEFARFIELLTPEAFDRLLENIPPEITDREPLAFGDYDGVTVARLQELMARPPA